MSSQEKREKLANAVKLLFGEGQYSLVESLLDVPMDEEEAMELLKTKAPEGFQWGWANDALYLIPNNQFYTAVDKQVERLAAEEQTLQVWQLKQAKKEKK